MSDGVNYQPRLATLRKWPHFNGYGFNLHAERGKAGQYIGKVDEGSPAEAAGLKQGDRIVEVDGTNIGNENHQQVVGRIKAGGDQTTLLVVDNETDKYFKDQRIVVRSGMDEIRKLDSLTGPRPGGADTNEETGENNAEVNGITNAEIERDAAPSSQNEIDLDSDAEEVVQPVTNDLVEKRESLEVEAVHSEEVEALPDYEPESNTAEFTPPPPPVDEPEDERAPTPELIRDPSPEPIRDPSPELVRDPSPEPYRAPTPEPVRAPTPEPIREPSPEPVRAPTPEPVRAPTPEPIRAPTPEPVRAPTPEPAREPTPEPVRKEQPTPAVATNDAQANGDPLKHMSAKQLREQLAAKKKADAKSKKIAFKDKYDIFQKL